MKKTLVSLMVVGLWLGVQGMAMAGSSTTTTANYEVEAINEISLSSTSISLTVNAATAGSEPDQATDETSTYSITTNCGSTNTKKITAAINTAMPTGNTLKINMTAPSTGTSAGAVTLTASAVDAVTAISSVAESGIAITYSLDSTVAGGIIAASNKTVTLTITDNS